jgi:oligoribonuclease NrnB/cAMP/cGMP phosphodiesterase (DHH superfamily)
MIRLKPLEITTVLYHGGKCIDGFLSRVIAEKYFTENGMDIVYIPVTNRTKLPKLQNARENILICDFSYPFKIIGETMAHHKVLILDHHSTAENDLIDMPDEMKVFSMLESGASLTWKYFYPDQEMPLLVKYVKDYDNWKNEMRDYMIFAAWFISVTQTFESYIKYLTNETLLMCNMYAKGPPMLEHALAYCENLLSKVSIVFQKIGNEKFFVGYINTTSNITFLGDMIMKKYPFLDFVAMYLIAESPTPITLFSLRSTDQHYPCDKISIQFGGGGHRNASGFVTRFSYRIGSELDTIYDTNKMYNMLSSLKIKTLTLTSSSIEDVKLYHCVIGSFPYRKYEIGSYLLQKKHDDVQNATHILLRTGKIQRQIQISAVMIDYYDAESDSTSYQLCLNKNLSQNEKQKIQEICGLPYGESNMTIQGEFSLL